MNNKLVKIAAGDKIAIHAKPDRTPYSRWGYCYRVEGGRHQAHFTTFESAWIEAVEGAGAEQVDGVALTEIELSKAAMIARTVTRDD